MTRPAQPQPWEFVVRHSIAVLCEVVCQVGRSYSLGRALVDGWLAVAALWAVTEPWPTAPVLGIPLVAALGVRLRPRAKAIWTVVAARVAGVDPTRAIDAPAQALKVADEMLRAAAIMPLVGRDDARLWLTVAVGPFAALLFSASPAASGRGIGWVRSTVEDLAADAQAWAVAAAGCDERVKAWVSRYTSFDARQARSVGVAMRQALTLRVGPR